MASDVGGELKYIISVDDSKFSDKLNQASREFDKFADKLDDGSAQSGKALGKSIGEGSDQASSSFRKFVSDSLGALGELTSALGNVSFQAFTTAAGAASTALTAMVSKGINIGSSLEKNRLSFEALTGSVEKSEKVLSSVADFAAENPYQLLDVSNVARELVAMGRSADQVEGDLAKLGAIGVATGADLQGLGHVYGQISAQGRMMSNDMYQLVNQGVAIMPALAKVTGKSMNEVKDLISDGAITMEVFEEALTQVVDPEMYDNLLQKMNNTIPRQLDRLKGSISTFATSLVGIDKWTGRKLETGLAQTYTNILKHLADQLRNPKLIASAQKFGEALARMADKIIPYIDKIANVLSKVLDTLSEHTGALLPIVGGALVMFGKLGSSIPGVGSVIGGLSDGVKTLGKAFVNLFKVNPLLGVFVSLLAIGLPKAMGDSGFRASISSLMQSLGKLASAIAPVIARLAELGATIGSKVLIATVNALAKVLEVLANAITAIPEPVLTALVGAFLGFMALKKVANVLGLLGGGLKEVANVGGKAGQGVGTIIAGVLKPLGNNEVIKGAASAALVGVAVFTIAKGIAEVSNTNINVGNLAGMLVATGIIAVMMNIIGKFATNIALGALASTLIGVSLYAIAIGLGKVSEVGSNINIGALGIMAAAIAIAAVIMGVIGIFAEFVAIGAIATAVLGVGLYTTAVCLAEASKRGSEIDMGGILALSGAIAETSILLTALLLFTAFGAIGVIATAIIGGGLYIAAAGLQGASEMGRNIDLGGIVALMGAVALTSTLLTSILLLSVFGAVGAIATAIIGTGLMVTAFGLKYASEAGKEIQFDGLMNLMGAVVITSTVLGLISLLAVFGAIGAIATSIIGGGLALTALGLKSASENGAQINQAGLVNLMECVTFTSAIMAIIMPLAAFGTISSIATGIIAGGLVLTAKGLLEASILSAQIKPNDLKKLQQAVIYIAELQTGNIFNNLINLINSGILVKVAENVYYLASNLSQTPVVRTSAIKKIKEAVEEFASMGTGDLFGNISNLINSGMLKQISENVREITNTFGEMKPVKIETIKKIKEAIETFSQIKIEGNGLFEDKGGASDMLLHVAQNAVRIVDLFSSMNVEGLSYKMDALEMAISRNGQGWPVNWAESFVNYINKLNEAKANFLGVAVFIKAVNTWDTAILLDKFNEFEKAISRDGKAWEAWYAEQFINYINKLVSNSKSLDLVDQFIRKVIDWNTADLLSQFNKFEQAISRDGKSWEPWYAERFRDYIKKLVEDNQSLDLVDTFIRKVGEWNTAELLTQFNDFEKAVSRDGKGWEPWYAQRFHEYIDKLIGDGKSFDLVNDFINKVKDWNSKELLTAFNDFEKAVSRDGKSWEPWYAQRFNEYIRKLTEDQHSLDLVSQFIEKVQGWAGNDLLTKFNEFERAVSRNGEGWPLYWVNQFKDYIKKLSEGDGGFDMVTTFIDKVRGWATDDLKSQFDKFENAISRGGAGWPSYWADQFGNYVKKLSGESNLDSVTNFIDHVMNWKTNELKGKFDEFENAVSRGGQGWPSYWADQFKAYIQKLGEITGSMDTINAFIEKVQSWTTVSEGGSDLRTTFDKFENAVSRGGEGWPLVWAEQFKAYLQELSGIGEIGLDGIGNFITKVGEWTTVGEGGTDLKTQFDKIENAISRGGAGWPLVWAEQFVDYMNKIGDAQECGAMEALTPIFTKALEFQNLETVEANLNTIERIISRDGKGYPINWATGFVDYWNEFSALTYDFGSIKRYIEMVSGLTPENILSCVDEIVNSISQFVEAAKGKSPEFLTTGGEFAINLIDGWKNEDVPSKINPTFDKVFSALNEKKEAFKEMGRALASNVVAGFVEKYWDAVNAGKNLVDGIILGIDSKIQSVRNSAVRLADAANLAFQNRLDIDSPSKVFRTNGNYIGQGLVAGLVDQYEDVGAAAEGLADVIREPFDDLNQISVDVAGQVGRNNETGNGYNKNLTINQNNNINNGMDYDMMMADLRWQLFTA